MILPPTISNFLRSLAVSMLFERIHEDGIEQLFRNRAMRGSAANGGSAKENGIRFRKVSGSRIVRRPILGYRLLTADGNGDKNLRPPKVKPPP